jgi:hypothetical protein
MSESDTVASNPRMTDHEFDALKGWIRALSHARQGRFQTSGTVLVGDSQIVI